MWLGYDDALAAPVAIKVLAGSLVDDLDVRNRFLEEARILRRADSERLVRVHDIGELPDGRPYFVMSYADRGTLADRMRERQLPVGEALAIAEEIARGVEVINRLGIIHRDLKPSNILFQTAPDGSERLLIADLGLAKALAHASGAFTLPVGTPGYMSPEQARFGGGLDVRADVYGLGALTYHLLTGRPPGPAPVKAGPSELRPELGPAFDEVILRALAADREQRWPTAEAFARALTSLRPTEAPQGPQAGQAAQNLAPPPPTVIVSPGDRVTRAEEPPKLDQTRMPPPVQQPPATVQDVPAERYAPGADASPDDIGTTEVRVPEDVLRGKKEPTPGPDDQRMAGHPQQPPGPIHPREAQGPGGPGGPYGPGGPAPGGKGASAGDRKKRALLLAAAVAVVTVAVVGGLLAGTLFSGGSGKKAPSPTPSSVKGTANLTTVSIASGRLSVGVPQGWAKGPEQTWVPSQQGVGFTDTTTEPVLRAAPNVPDFRRAAGKTPGVFVGLTTAGQTVPPQAVQTHQGCTKGNPENYTNPSGTLSGQIIRFTGCTTGVPSIAEVGLKDKAGKFALWIRIKQVDTTNDLTTQILDTIKAS